MITSVCLGSMTAVLWDWSFYKYITNTDIHREHKEISNVPIIYGRCDNLWQYTPRTAVCWRLPPINNRQKFVFNRHGVYFLTYYEEIKDIECYSKTRANCISPRKLTHWEEFFLSRSFLFIPVFCFLKERFLFSLLTSKLLITYQLNNAATNENLLDRRKVPHNYWFFQNFIASFSIQSTQDIKHINSRTLQRTTKRYKKDRCFLFLSVTDIRFPNQHYNFSLYIKSTK